MNKHFLVTVSDEYEHLTGVMFVCSFFKQSSEHRITLLHICRRDSSDMNKALLEMWESPDDKLSGKVSIGARKALEKSTELLNRSYMSIDQLKTKTCAERFGKVRDILSESSKGSYDAVILGKRASYTFQWIFERPADETIKGMLNDSLLETPLWVCPESEEGRKHVLVCIDGSDASYRAVDHVGYILANQDQHHIRLFTIGGGSETAEAYFKRSKEILHEHNISDNRITAESTWGFSVPGTILRTAQSGGYAAVAVGLKGTGNNASSPKNLAGATITELVTKVDKLSLWCVP